MSDETFKWEESDSSWTKYESTNEKPIDLYGEILCPECGENTICTWFDGDADRPSWTYECDDCEINITVYPTKVRATASDMNL